jgi:RNA polymerase sigma-70 factor (ECF subfamily)
VTFSDEPGPDLLEHGAFLRRLARSLVVDEQRAEDVVQDAYMVVLQRPPPPHVRAKAWLAGIVRNLARRQWRTEGRRVKREGAAAKFGQGPPTDDLVARLETQQRIAQEVLALEEPGRTAVVLRYYDGLTPTQIAGRLDVPVRTIETRLRRARERLRDRLDRTTPGGRRAWHAALLPFLLSPDAIASGATGATGATGAGTSTSGAAGGTGFAGAAVVSLKLAAIAAPVLVLAGFFAERAIDRAPGPSGDAPPRAERPDETGAPSLRGAPAEAARERRRRLAAEREAGQLRAEIARLERRRNAARGEVPPEGLVPLPPATPFLFEGYEETLLATDWDLAAEAVLHINPLVVETLAAIEAEGPFPPSAGDIQTWAGGLLRQTLELRDAGIPGTGTNGVFTHPVVIVNLVRAVLRHGGLPLSEDDERALLEIGARYAEEDARRLAGYGEQEFRLRQAIDEAALKDRMFADVFALLNPEQETLLHPAPMRGRLRADMFSTAVFWAPLAVPQTYRDRDDLVEACTAEILKQCCVDESFRPFAEDAARAWAAGFPPGYLDWEPDVLARAGMWPVDRVRTAAERQLALLEAVHQRLSPDSEAARSVRQELAVPVPIRTE